jgi:hypothetical protein
MLPLALLAILTVSAPNCAVPLRAVCTCILGPAARSVADVRAGLQARDVVFTGRVVTTRIRMDSLRTANEKGDSLWFRVPTLVATVQVAVLWKGLLADTVTVETPAATTACGAYLGVGGVYLIDGGRDLLGVIQTSRCGWTQPVGDAAALLAWLREAVRP